MNYHYHFPSVLSSTHNADGSLDVVIDEGAFPVEGPVAAPVSAPPPAPIVQLHGGSELAQYAGTTERPKDDDPNELLPNTWPGAPGSISEWSLMTSLEQARSMAQQVEALRQYQFDHVLFTDRILIDGRVITGFQPMEGAPFDRRFTTAGGILRLEDGQPKTVGRPEAPPSLPPLPPAEEAPVVGTMHIDFPQVGTAFDHPMRACDAVLIEFDIPQDYACSPTSVGWFSGVEFPGNPWMRTIAVSRNGQLVIPGTPPGIVSPSVTFTIGNPNLGNLADINFERGDHVALLVQSYGPADKWGGMRFQLNTPR